MFIRKKKIKNQEYAYLVKNKYNKRKKQSRQKSTKYLGRVITLGSVDRQTQALTVEEALINELSLYNFKKKDRMLMKGNIIIDLDNFSVVQDGKNICLELNEGFLCNLTLKNILEFDSNNLNQKELIHRFADALLSAGINLHHDSFIQIFNSSFKLPNS